MILSSLDIKDHGKKKELYIVFTNEKNKVEIHLNISYDNEQTKNIFNQFLKLRVCLGQQCIEKIFEKFDVYKFLMLINKKNDLRKHLPNIAKIILEQLEKDISADLEDIYHLLSSLLEKLIEGKDYSQVITDFANNNIRSHYGPNFI